MEMVKISLFHHKVSIWVFGLILAAVKPVAELNRKSFDMDFGEILYYNVFCVWSICFSRGREMGEGPSDFPVWKSCLILPSDIFFFNPSQDIFHEERFRDSSTTELAFSVKGKENIYFVVDP